MLSCGDTQATNCPLCAPTPPFRVLSLGFVTGHTQFYGPHLDPGTPYQTSTPWVFREFKRFKGGGFVEQTSATESESTWFTPASGHVARV